MNRYPELDLLRTAAILLMVVYHAAFDLSQFYGWDIAVFSGGWYVLARGTATLFLLLAGISAAVSYNRMPGIPAGARWRKHALRFARIGAVAMLVSAATYLANEQTYVRFGILHLIALSALILPLYARLKEGAAVIGVVILLLGPRILEMRADTPLLLPLGIRPHAFQTVDYFPLIPWLGVMLIGYGIGYGWYVRRTGSSRNHRADSTAMSRKTFVLNASVLTFPGRHALLLYVIHQPVILGALWLILGRPAL